jgi:hypothetical protein
MLSFKQFICESKEWVTTHHLFRDEPEYNKTFKSKTRPSVTELAKAWGGAKGKDDGRYWAGAGRCFEFADQLHHNMKEVGYKGHRVMTSKEWARKGTGNTKRFTEHLHDENDSSHAWIMHDGKHYDSMNPEGVDHPSQLKFYSKYFGK